MERRVRLVVTALLLAAMLTLALPLAVTVAERRTSQLAVERDRQLQVLAEQTLLAADPASVVQRYRAVYGEPALVTDADGVTLARAGDLGSTDGDAEADEAEVARAIRLLRVDDPVGPLATVWPWTGDSPLRGGTVTDEGEVVATALIRVDVSDAAAYVRTAWLLILLGAALLVALALVAARSLGRWVVGPVVSLEDAARAVATGHLETRVLPAGPPELRGLVAQFNAMIAVVERSLDDQRRLVADASHQLRNPLTAVRLRAESLGPHLTSGQQTHASLLAELDRLEALLDALMTLARAQETAAGREAAALGRAPGSHADAEASPVTTTQAVPAAEVVAERAAAWLPVTQERDQVLVVGTCTETPVPGLDLGQVLDVLIDNASTYAGPATITLTAEQTVEPGQAAAGVVVSVLDDGPGMPPGDWDLAPTRFWRGAHDLPGTGLGLAIAAEVLAGHGGRLELGPGPSGGTLARTWWPAASEDGGSR